MDGICKINCTGDLEERYDAGLCAPVFRKYGYNRFVAIKCGTSFTDIKDSTEWDTKLADGDVVVSPDFGKFTLGTPSTSTIPGGCGEEYPEFTETTWEFTTPSTASDYTDEDYWYFFSKYAIGYTMGYLNCEGRLYLNDDAIAVIRESGAGAAAVSDPGLQISLTEKPMFIEGPNGAGKAGLWRAAGKFIHSQMIRSCEIPGLIESLFPVVTP